MSSPDLKLHISEVGEGQVRQAGVGWQLRLPAVMNSAYHNAQISTYVQRRDFAHRAPLRLHIRAHATGQIQGTAGFGFWNHPYAPNEQGGRLPKALWFFYSSPPGNLALAAGVPGPGWKAATFNALRWQFMALLPAAPIGFLLMRIPAVYRRLWPVGQHALGVSEKLLDADLLAAPHDYTLEWGEKQVRFLVDGELIHQTRLSPPGKMGFIAWVDNQYAVVTPQGKFGFGLVNVPEAQSLVIDSVSIQPG